MARDMTWKLKGMYIIFITRANEVNYISHK